MKLFYSILIVLFLQTTLFSQNGIVKYYYPNGKLRAEISYTDNVLDGLSIWYFLNGNKSKEINYSEGKINGTMKYYYSSGLLKAEYSVTNGVRDGLTKIYYHNGGLKEVLNYDFGKLLKVVKIPYDSTYVAPIEKFDGAIRIVQKKQKVNQYICDSDICPEPIGGMSAIQSNLVYPKLAKLYGLEGKVILVATISKEGKVKGVKIVKGLGLGGTEAAINAVKKTRFLPGQNKGKIVQSHVTLIIKFKLPKKKNELALKPFSLSKIHEKISNKIKKSKTINAKRLLTGKKKLLLNDNFDYLKKKKSKMASDTLKYKNLSCNVDVCPEPIGGMKAIMKNLIVPHRVYDYKLKGYVVVSAKIDSFGYVRDTKVIKKMGNGLDEAAEVAILDTRFKPGLKKGKPVWSNVIIVIHYNYEKKQKR